MYKGRWKHAKQTQFSLLQKVQAQFIKWDKKRFFKDSKNTYYLKRIYFHMEHGILLHNSLYSHTQHASQQLTTMNRDSIINHK